MEKRICDGWYKKALENGVSKASFYYRIEVMGMSREEAATAPRMGQGGRKKGIKYGTSIYGKTT